MLFSFDSVNQTFSSGPAMITLAIGPTTGVVVPLIVELDVDAGLLVVVVVCVVVLLEQPIRLMITTAIMHTTPMRMVNLFVFMFLPPVWSLKTVGGLALHGEYFPPEHWHHFPIMRRMPFQVTLNS
jgi:hypothetical protein